MFLVAAIVFPVLLYPFQGSASSQQKSTAQQWRRHTVLSPAQQRMVHPVIKRSLLLQEMIQRDTAVHVQDDIGLSP